MEVLYEYIASISSRNPTPSPARFLLSPFSKTFSVTFSAGHKPNHKCRRRCVQSTGEVKVHDFYLHSQQFAISQILPASFMFSSTCIDEWSHTHKFWTRRSTVTNHNNEYHQPIPTEPPTTRNQWRLNWETSNHPTTNPPSTSTHNRPSISTCIARV